MRAADLVACWREAGPKAGCVVTVIGRDRERTRAAGCWVGRRKTAGRGEGWSNLVFDQTQDMKAK